MKQIFNLLMLASVMTSANLVDNLESDLPHQLKPKPENADKFRLKAVGQTFTRDQVTSISCHLLVGACVMVSRACRRV